MTNSPKNSLIKKTLAPLLILLTVLLPFAHFHIDSEKIGRTSGKIDLLDFNDDSRPLSSIIAIHSSSQEIKQWFVAKKNQKNAQNSPFLVDSFFTFPSLQTSEAAAKTTQVQEITPLVASLALPRAPPLA